MSKNTNTINTITANISTNATNANATVAPCRRRRRQRELQLWTATGGPVVDPPAELRAGLLEGTLPLEGSFVGGRWFRGETDHAGWYVLWAGNIAGPQKSLEVTLCHESGTRARCVLRSPEDMLSPPAGNGWRRCDDRKDPILPYR